MTIKQVYQLLERSTEKNPEKIAIYHRNTGISYGHLLTYARNFAEHILSIGLTPGFRGGILTNDPVEYISAYFGIQMAGGIAVGLNTQTTKRTLTYHVNDCEMELLIVDKRYINLVNETMLNVTGIRSIISENVDELTDDPKFLKTKTSKIFKRKPSNLKLPFRNSCDIAQIIYTSGTTGKPKGVMLRHANLIANTKSIISYLKIDSIDKVMAVLPFFYSYGNSVMLTHICQGATLVVNQNLVYPNVILNEMEKYDVTGFSGVPSTFALLLHRSNIEQYRFPSLRYITQAGAPMSPALAQRLQNAFPGVDIYIMYGQTEASARLSYLPPKDLMRKAGSIGIPIPGVELRVLDEDDKEVPIGKIGEIVARGENIMAGYWNSPDESQKVLRSEGLRTGDLAYQDKDGYFYIVSRKSDIIKSGSHRIAPKEIEDVVMEHESISEAAVVGIEDEVLGEAIWLFVVLIPGKNLTSLELKRHCSYNLPAYKVPHRIYQLDCLPKTATGKIKKNVLKTKALKIIKDKARKK